MLGGLMVDDGSGAGGESIGMPATGIVAVRTGGDIETLVTSAAGLGWGFMGGVGIVPFVDMINAGRSTPGVACGESVPGTNTALMVRFRDV